jgi:hypothetical protein
VVDIETEWKLLEQIEATDLIVAVNIFNRNAYGGAAISSRDLWDVVYICDIDPVALAAAEQLASGVKCVADPDIVLADTSLDAVGLFTLADARPAPGVIWHKITPHAAEAAAYGKDDHHKNC